MAKGKAILQTLKAVHAANVGVDSGSTTADKLLWVRAGEFEYAWQARHFRKLLRRQDIVARVAGRAMRYFVEVQRRDLDAALAALRDNPPPKKYRGSHWLHRPIAMLVFSAFSMVLIIVPVWYVDALGLIDSPSAISTGIALFFAVAVFAAFIGAQTLYWGR